jgi:hypothetical protein
MAPDLTVVPASEASWEDLQAIFGTRGAGATCWRQRYSPPTKRRVAMRIGFDN